MTYCVAIWIWVNEMNTSAASQMPASELTTPVILLIFNRPDTTALVFAEIAKAKPSRLLVVADGPRQNHIDDVKHCAATRAIIDQVDWDCEVSLNYAEANLGLRRRVSSGLNWAFDLIDEAIILEDDCLPHPAFFRFCEELLDRYRDDQRIMMICGTNVLAPWHADTQSFHFSVYGSIWGWATWRRAWDHYDPNMATWSDPDVQKQVRDVLCDDRQFRHRSDIFWRTYRGELPSWDYQWTFARLLQSGLSIVPSMNLVSNVGFDERATNTTFIDDRLAKVPTQPLTFPLRSPIGVAPDRSFDAALFDYTYRFRKWRKLQAKIQQLRPRRSASPAMEKDA